MKRSIMLVLAICLTAGLTAAQANATVTLTFEGVGDNTPVGSFYSGLGITFSSNGLGIVDADAGGSGNFGHEPSPSTALYFLTGPAATMDVSGGFTTGFSFFYTAINNPGFVKVYDGAGGTGNLLATLNLPVTPSDGGDPTGAFSPFVPFGVTFSGTAYSVDFGGTVNQIGFDNITLGSEAPTGAVPEPGTILAALSILGPAGFLFRRRA